jgi:hypothetical protein
MQDGVLRAVIEEVEPGLFQASYPGEMNSNDPDGGSKFPDRHIGTDRDGVRMWVETMAANLGYERVEWGPSDPPA